MLTRIVAAIVRRVSPPVETIVGYEHPDLIETVFRKTLSYAAPPPLHLDAATVLDFGGGCGIHYLQAQDQAVRWAIVETPAMVERAAELATDRLRFFTDIAEAAAWLGDVDVMHSNGALQYTPDPVGKLTQLCAIRARRMHWDRISLSTTDQPEEIDDLSLLGASGPGKSLVRIKDKAVSLAHIKVPVRIFIEAHRGYDLVVRGADFFRFNVKEAAR